MPLQTRNVFIDTQSFVRAGLDFQSRAIQSFAEACDEGKLKHIMTTVVMNEVQDKIKEHIREALGKVQEFRRKAKILEGSTDPIIAGLFAPFDPSAIEAQALAVFQDFTNKAGSSIVDLRKVDAEEVFRRYFGQEAPFQAGKKKDEFPDAFSMLAVENSLNSQECCYIVSEDGDLKAFCEGHKKFILIETLGKLLDLYNSHEDERSNFIKEYFASKHDDIVNGITSQMKDAEFNNISSWEGSQVVDHEILNIGPIEIDIIEIDDEQCFATIDSWVDFNVVVEGPDFNNGTYDKETGRMYTFEDVVRVEAGSMPIRVEIVLDFDVSDGKFEATNMDVRVQGIANGIEVSVDENEWDDPR